MRKKPEFLWSFYDHEIVIGGGRRRTKVVRAE
jgi:hypothetical protein